MTAASGHRTPTLVASPPSIAVEWAIAREAVREAMPDLELPAARRRGAADVRLCIAVRNGGCRAELRDTQTGASHPIEIGAVTTETIGVDGFEHIAVAEGGRVLLAATTRDGDAGVRLLYASTTLLDRLGIRGGRYSRPVLGE